MRKDLRPYRAKQILRQIESAYIDWFLRPQFEHLGGHPLIMKPWYVNVHGPNIRIGDSVHMICAPERRVSLTVWEQNMSAGSIDIGDYALLCPGVRLDSATIVRIGSNSMLASGCYVTDADWHDVYNRTETIGGTGPVVLEDNVWLGDGVIVCKGVTIGANSVIGAGSVVTGDIPPNVIAAGTPARCIRSLDASRKLVRRADLLADAERLARETDQLERYLLGNNSWLNWLRSLIRPRRGD